jgi:hypothetical protein
MSEQLAPPSNIQDLEQVLRRNEQYYKEVDPDNITLGYFAEAFRYCLLDKPLRQLVEQTLSRPGMDASQTFNLFNRQFSRDALRHDPKFYPYDYTSADAYMDQYFQISSDAHRLGDMETTALTRHVQSNIANRYKSVKLLSYVLADRFDRAPTHLDVGSSMLHGDKMLIYGKDIQGLEFDPFDIVGLESDFGAPPASYLKTITDISNVALKDNIEFGAMAGIDITNVDDPEVADWVRACSFKPDELKDVVKVEQYDTLEFCDPDHERIQFFQGDFSDNRDASKFRKMSDSKDYDFVTLSTVLYQQGSEKAKQDMLINAMNYLSPNGILIVQDAKDGNFAKPYNYTTEIIDNMDDHPSQQEIIRWKDGRCTEAILGAGNLSIKGRRLTLAHALEQLA